MSKEVEKDTWYMGPAAWAPKGRLVIYGPGTIRPIANTLRIIEYNKFEKAIKTIREMEVFLRICAAADDQIDNEENADVLLNTLKELDEWPKGN